MTELPIQIKIRISNRMSFETLGEIGTSMSSILRDAISVGLNDKAAGPEENALIGLEFEKAKQGSLDIYAVLSVAPEWFKDVAYVVSVKMAAEFVVTGLKKGLIYLTGKPGSEEMDNGEDQSKLLDKVERSTVKLSKLLEKLESQGLILKINGKTILDFDKDDIKNFTVEPIAGKEIIVHAYPIQLHESTQRGWLRIKDVSANRGIELKSAAYRMNIEPKDEDPDKIILKELARLFEYNIGRTNRHETISLVVQPMLTHRRTVRHLVVRGFAP